MTFVLDLSNKIAAAELSLTKLKFSAAHCIQGKGIQKKLLPGDIRVLIGAYDLTSKTEMRVQQRDVQEIHVHPEWDVYSDTYDANLAVLLLKELVLFTSYIRPVCIPADDTLIDDVKGLVVGWGLREDGTKLNTEFIKRATVTALSVLDCLTKYPQVGVIPSPRTYCGQGEDGNANRGDSGGGFYVQNQESVWVQHGIVSSLRSNSSGFVNDESVMVYTNVAKFKNWIAGTVRQSGVAVGEARIYDKVNLECVFDYDSSNL